MSRTRHFVWLGGGERMMDDSTRLRYGAHPTLCCYGFPTLPCRADLNAPPVGKSGVWAAGGPESSSSYHSSFSSRASGRLICTALSPRRFSALLTHIPLVFLSLVSNTTTLDLSGAIEPCGVSPRKKTHDFGFLRDEVVQSCTSASGAQSAFDRPCATIRRRD